MKACLALFFVALVGCIPSMHTGPDPHSIPYSAISFNRVSDYLDNHPEVGGFSLEDAPSTIPHDILDAMNEMNFDYYKVDSIYQVYYCGSGVVGKGWGFIHGHFSDSALSDPSSVRFEGWYDRLSYLERLDSNWYRFAIH
jgi:hypothetical protein